MAGMKKAKTHAIITAVTLLCTLWAASAYALTVGITGDRLTVHAEQVPLHDVLRKMAGLGINVRIDPVLNPLITAAFDDRDIQEGVASLLKSYNYVLIWKALEGTAGPAVRLAEIQVFKPGKKELMQPLIDRRNLPVSRSPKDGSLFVSDEILLKLDPEMDSAGFEELLGRIGATVIDSNVALGIYRIRLPENSDIPSIVAQLARLPGVGKAEPNYVYPIAPPYAGSDWDGPSYDGSAKRAAGNAVPVAVLDSGLRAGYGLEGLILGSLDAFDPETPISDALGHGTQMALVAAGVVMPKHGAYPSNGDAATYNPIVPIRVIDDNGYTSNFSIMRAIDFARTKGARVMSLSWGSETNSGFLEEALGYARSKDMIVVASAGNEPTGKPVYPAAYDSVIAVGALDPGGRAWEKSNYGDFVEIYAPGFASFPVGYKGDPGSYAGTSISAAFVANVIADYLTHHPEATTEDVLEALTESKQKQ